MSPERKVVATADGSYTVLIPELNVSYHSHYGAVQESLHVFINAGLRYQWQQQPGTPLRILEMGFGTGLNALLTLNAATAEGRYVHYTALELYPLQTKEWQALHFTGAHNETQVLEQLHQSPWHNNVPLTPYFILRKEQADLHRFESASLFDVLYYDAFAPRAQPELWTEAVFTKLFGLLNPGGVLVTYCSKGSVRRAMQSAGFVVEKIAGPKWKREMVRAKRV